VTRSDCWAKSVSGERSGLSETIAERPEASAYFLTRSMKLMPSAAIVARDIRNQYTIGYKHTTPKSVGGYRTIKVDARAHGYSKANGQDSQRLLRRSGTSDRRRELILAASCQLLPRLVFDSLRGSR